MAKWGEIKCPRCAAPPIALWDALVRQLKESDAREARLETRIEELEAKLAQQDDLVQAAVAAALREAAKQAETRDAKWMREKYDISYRKKRYNLLDVHNCENKFANILSEDIEDAILALITPDAQAALDRVVAAERERCAKVVETAGLYYAGIREGAILDRVAAAIRKGGE